MALTAHPYRGVRQSPAGLDWAGDEWRWLLGHAVMSASRALLPFASPRVIRRASLINTVLRVTAAHPLQATKLSSIPSPRAGSSGDLHIPAGR